MKKSRVLKTIYNIVLIIMLILFIVTKYIKNNFPDVSFEQLYYTFTHSKGFSFSSIKEGLIYTIILLPVLIIIILLPTLFIKKFNNTYNLSLYIFKYKVFNICIPIKYTLKH